MRGAFHALFIGEHARHAIILEIQLISESNRGLRVVFNVCHDLYTKITGGSMPTTRPITFRSSPSDARFQHPATINA